MAEQFIVTIGREFGSGGKHIGRALAKELGVELYDRNIIEHLAEELDVKSEHLHKYDEKKKIPFLSRTVRGHSSSPEDHLAEMQFNYIRKLADSGESFVIVGRCSEEVLRDRKGVINIFIKANREYKIKRVMEQFELSREGAIEKMDRHDRTRKAFHNHHSQFKWGDSRNYDLCIDSTHLGTVGTANFLADYVRKRNAK